MPYQIKPHSDSKHTGYVVVTPDGNIANSHIHKTYEEAKRHMELLMAYWPEVKDDGSRG